VLTLDGQTPDREILVTSHGSAIVFTDAASAAIGGSFRKIALRSFLVACGYPAVEKARMLLAQKSKVPDSLITFLPGQGIKP
jgi:hypothetical protein